MKVENESSEEGGVEVEVCASSNVSDVEDEADGKVAAVGSFGSSERAVCSTEDETFYWGERQTEAKRDSDHLKDCDASTCFRSQVGHMSFPPPPSTMLGPRRRRFHSSPSHLDQNHSPPQLSCSSSRSSVGNSHSFDDVYQTDRTAYRRRRRRLLSTDHTATVPTATEPQEPFPCTPDLPDLSPESTSPTRLSHAIALRASLDSGMMALRTRAEWMLKKRKDTPYDHHDRADPRSTMTCQEYRDLSLTPPCTSSGMRRRRQSHSITHADLHAAHNTYHWDVPNVRPTTRNQRAYSEPAGMLMYASATVGGGGAAAFGTPATDDLFATDDFSSNQNRPSLRLHEIASARSSQNTVSDSLPTLQLLDGPDNPHRASSLPSASMEGNVSHVQLPSQDASPHHDLSAAAAHEDRLPTPHLGATTVFRRNVSTTSANVDRQDGTESSPSSISTQERPRTLISTPGQVTLPLGAVVPMEVNDTPAEANNHNPVETSTTAASNVGTTDREEEAPEQQRRRQRQQMRILRINHYFQCMIALVALLFSMILFAILVCWVVLTSAYVVSIDKLCDVPLKKYYWFATMQLILDVFRTDIMKHVFRWDPNSSNNSRRIPLRVIIYNIAYLSYAVLVLKTGVESVFILPHSDDPNPITCQNTAPELFQTSRVFVSLSVLAWSTIVVGYIIPFCFLAVVLTRSGYSPRGAGAQLFTGQGVEGPAGAGGTGSLFYREGADPRCIDMMRAVKLEEFPDTYPKECCICMGDFASGEEIVATRCEHVFHKSCCQEWLLQARTCPVCRTDIPTSLGLEGMRQTSLISGEGEVVTESTHRVQTNSSLGEESQQPQSEAAAPVRDDLESEVENLLRMLRQQEELLRRDLSNLDPDAHATEGLPENAVRVSGSSGGNLGTIAGNVASLIALEEGRLNSG